MKKLGSIFLALAMAAGMLTGCSGGGSSSSAPASDSAGTLSSSSLPALTASQVASASEAAPEGAATVRIASLQGPTTMGMVELMRASDEGSARQFYNVTMYGAAEEVSAQVISGDVDIALVPANLASVLYNRTEGQVQVMAVNTLGVLYIVSTGEQITSVADLAGKTIYATGKGTTPEYALNYVLRQNGLEPGADVTVEYMSEATQVLAALQAAEGPAVAMLPQPYVTTAQMQMENLDVALDLTEEWNKVSPDSALITGVTLVRTDFARQNPQAVDIFLQEYQASVEWVNANTADAAQLVADYGIVPKVEVAQQALPECNITCLTGDEMQAKVSGYLQVLYDADPASVGGAMPSDDFYYGAGVA